MLKSFVIISAVVAAVSAQIPSTGVSSGCTTFLNKLNTDSDLARCTSTLTTALAAFAPGSNSNVTPAQISSALNNICADNSQASSACSQTSISSLINDFGAECASEITSNNEDVVGIYDVLYSLIPMQKSICSKNDNGDWCVLSGAPVSGETAEEIQSSLFTQQGQVVVPNTSAFSENNLPFLFIAPSLPQEELCVACTRNVLRSYITFQDLVPYAPGLSNSQLFQRQTDLFSAVGEKCGETFMSSEVKAAGAVKEGAIFGSSAAPRVDVGFQSIMAAVAGIMALAVSSAL